MTFFRWMVGLPFAAVVTAALFFMMAGLIGQDIRLETKKTPPIIKIFAATEPIGATEQPKLPKKIDKDPPEPIIRTTLPAGKPEPAQLPPETGKIIAPPIGPGPGGAPVLKHAPLYPEACRARGAEGAVLVQFDVTPEGSVVNIQIIESADSCFNRTVRSTVAKWKYPPAVQNGRATMRYGVIERFSFELTE